MRDKFLPGPRARREKGEINGLGLFLIVGVEIERNDEGDRMINDDMPSRSW